MDFYFIYVYDLYDFVIKLLGIKFKVLKVELSQGIKI